MPKIVKQTAYVWLLQFALLPLIAFADEANQTQFEEIEWTQLMPKEDFEALMDPPEFMLDIVDGSEADNLNTLQQKAGSDEKAAKFNLALKSQKVIAEYDGKAIRIPGFIVPLTTNEDRDVVSFFVVPYFGACLHLPPPPPNQMLFAEWEEGVTVESLATPMWFEGTISIETQSNETGTSAYRLIVAGVQPYVG